MGPEFRSGSYKVTARPVSTKGRGCLTDDKSTEGHPHQGSVARAGQPVRQPKQSSQSLRTGQIESLDKDLGPGRTYTVDQTVAQATVDEYEALLMLPGTMKSDRLSSDDRVVSLVRDFITSGKPVGIVCYGAWTLLEAGVARGQSLPLSGRCGPTDRQGPPY